MRIMTSFERSSLGQTSMENSTPRNRLLSYTFRHYGPLPRESIGFRYGWQPCLHHSIFVLSRLSIPDQAAGCRFAESMLGAASPDEEG